MASYTVRSLANDRPTSWWVGLTAAVGLLVTTIVTAIWIHEQQATEAHIFETAFDDIKQRLPGHLIVDHGLRGTRAMMQATGGLDQLTAKQFMIYAASRDVPREFPGTRGIVLAKRLPPSDRVVPLAALQAKGWPVRRVFAVGSNPSDRFVVLGAIPEAPNREAIGLDVASEPARADAIRRAIRSGRAQVSAPLELIPLQGETEAGLIVFLPIFNGVMVPANEQERLNSAKGILFMPIKLSERMAQFGWPRQLFDLRLEDVTQPGQHALLYSSHATSSDGLSRSENIEVAGRVWRLSLTARPEFRSSLGLTPWWLISLLGLFLTGVATVAAFVVDRTLRRISRLNRNLQHQAAIRQIELQDAREGALAASRQFLTMIEENPHGIALVNAASNAVEQANPKFLELLPESDIALELLARFLRTPVGEQSGLEPFAIQGPDDRICWIRYTCSPLGSGTQEAAERYIVMVEDVTAAHEQRLLLDETLARLNLATAMVQIGVWYWSFDDDSVQWDDRMFDVFGRTADEREFLRPSYQFWVDSLHPDDVEAAETLLNQSTSTGTDWACNYRIICANGAIRTIEAFGVHRRDDTGKLIGMLGVCRDVTERLRLEADLIEAHREAEAANKAKDQFLANISHELRTPMNAILGLLQVLERGVLDIGQRQHVSGAKRAANALLRILNDILDFSRVESGLLDLITEPMSLQRITDATLELYDEAAKHKGLQLTARLQADQQRQYWGDELRIGQILNNLVDNAIKFTTTGKIEIAVSCVASEAQRDIIRFEVRDTGQGLGTVDTERLFQPFIQAEPSITRSHGGSGLGLAICRQLVLAMGGAIGAENIAGNGALFWFEIPLEHGAEARLQQVRQLEPDRTLILSLQEDYGRLLVGQLNSLGLKAELICDPAKLVSSLTKAHQQDEAFNLLLADLDAPAEDVSHIVAALQAAETHNAFPRKALIMLSGPETDAETIAQRALALMPDAALTKPVPALGLYEVISDLQRHGFTDRPHARPKFDEQQFAQILGAFAEAKVLVVEDNRTNQEVALALLEQFGLCADIVRNGQEAVERLATEDYALVLMDIHMPVLNGLDATRAIRAGGRNADVPIVAMTAAAFSDDRKRAFEASMSDFISKPIVVNRLAALLAKWLPRRGTNCPRGNGPAGLGATAQHAERFTTLDLDALQHRLGGGPDRARRVLDAFVEDFESWSLDAAQAFAERDHPRLSGLVHSLKGAASSIGAKRLAEATRVLDHELRANLDLPGNPRIDPLLAKLTAELDALITELQPRAWLARPAPQN